MVTSKFWRVIWQNRQQRTKLDKTLTFWLTLLQAVGPPRFSLAVCFQEPPVRPALKKIKDNQKMANSAKFQIIVLGKDATCKSVKIGSKEIKVSKSVKFLELPFENKTEHTNQTCKVAAAKIKSLRRIINR